MSKFKTSIPVDVAGVKQLLPEGSHIDGVTFDESAGTVSVHWQHDRFRTPFDHAVEFPMPNLERAQVPKGVKLLHPETVQRPKPVAECPHAENCSCPECLAKTPPAPAPPETVVEHATQAEANPPADVPPMPAEQPVVSEQCAPEAPAATATDSPKTETSVPTSEQKPVEGRRRRR